MVHFFIAIAIFLCIFIKQIVESYRNAEYDRKSKKSDEEERRLKGFTCTLNMLYDVEEYVQSGEHYDEICNDFASDFLFIFGNNWRNKLQIPPHGQHFKPGYLYPPGVAQVEWVVSLILASKGYLPLNLSQIPQFVVCRHGETFEIGKRFIQRIEYHLNQHGRNVRFVMSTNKNKVHAEFYQEGVAFGETERLW